MAWPSCMCVIKAAMHPHELQQGSSSLHAHCAAPHVLPLGSCDLQATKALLTAGPWLPVVCGKPRKWSHSLM